MSESEFFTKFIKDNQGIINKVCRIYTDNDDDYLDSFQEVALELWKSHKNFQHQSKVSTWVYRVALNVCITHFKKRKKNVATIALIDVDIKAEVTRPDHDEIKTLHGAIKKLKEFDRAIILLYLEEKSYKEIAEITGISVTNVGARVNRIKNKLKSMINGK